ncbi:BLUF domain-containing protein [Labedella populi]|uniref:BLUF domain-containing protein n=1 Tax=Labedella populi TaxID=2498850 RepID=A0A3S4A238_9MICO|nr:BLUF domain-containing protein [Labedella populi]RWZ68009.1 BLUF domain-containing protein [Labedella populi]
MLSIVYSSRASDSFDEAYLVDLLLRSRRNNKRLGLSGMLLHHGGHFLQAIEGPEDALRERMAIIASDPRHSSLRMLLEEEIPERTFPAWTMGHVEADDEPAAPGLRNVFEALAAGGDVSDSLPSLRELIRWYQVRAA